MLAQNEYTVFETIKQLVSGGLFSPTCDCVVTWLRLASAQLMH